MKLPSRRWFAVCAAVLAALAPAAIAFARAGGGQGFSGGGGHGGGGFSGGHGGGGGGAGGLIQLLFWILTTHPVIGIPLTIAIIVLFIYAQRQGSDIYQTSVIRRGGEIISDNERAAMLAPLMAADPQFHQQSLIERVTAAFGKLQSAWAQQNLSTVRPFISDGIFERFSLQFEEQKSLGYRNMVQNVEVEEAEIVKVRSDHRFDSVDIRIQARADDFDVALSTGKRISSNDRPESFVEVWTFLRCRGVTTRSNPTGLMEGRCPNCGAAVEMNQNANCAHCGAMLRSGAYDWVLVEITQDSEWVVRQTDELIGIEDLIARDPEFNAADLEDHASVLFWRHNAAQRTGNIDPLRKVASPEYCDAMTEELAAPKRSFFGECAVGSVDTRGVLSDGDWDRAMVEVRWAGTQFIVNQGTVQRTDQKTLSRVVLELSRRKGVLTDAGMAVSSAHCPKCGAPEAGGLSNACEFCGQVLNDGTKSWILTAIRTPADARQILGSLSPFAIPTPPQQPDLPAPVEALAWMIQMAAADGEINPRERTTLAAVARRRAMPPAQLETMISAALQGTLDLPQPQGPGQAKEWITAMAEEAMADGNLSREEYALLQKTGLRVGLVDFDIRMLVRRIRDSAYGDAKAALRGQRP